MMTRALVKLKILPEHWRIGEEEKLSPSEDTIAAARPILDMFYNMLVPAIIILNVVIQTVKVEDMTADW